MEGEDKGGREKGGRERGKGGIKRRERDSNRSEWCESNKKEGKEREVE